jgi:ankyrin repeat protein
VSAPLHAYREDFAYYEDRARGLLASARDGTEGAAHAFAQRGAPLTEEGARSVLANEHGLGTWEQLRHHVAGLSESGDPFVRAYRALEARDPAALQRLLDEHPHLVGERGTNGNDLLGMAAASGDDRLSELLLARGADPASANAHGWTALHQAAYSNQPRLAELLIQAGAPASISARGDGGTPLAVALFWGHHEVTPVLVSAGIAPANLRAAAGLGDLVLLKSLFGRDGRPTAAAGGRLAQIAI